LLATYENGKMSRRDLVQGLALLTASAGTMSAAGFQGNSINHVSMQVSDLQKSTDFYQRVFGCKVNKREGNNQLVFGKSFIVLRPAKPAGTVDHLARATQNPAFSFVTGSAGDPALVGELVTDVDTVFHLAAIVGVRSPKQVDGIIGAATFRLSPAEIQELSN